METSASRVRDPMLRPLLLCGAVAPLVYVATVAWGGTLFAGYSHIADPISALTQAGRAGTAGIESFFLIYNGLALAYAFGGIGVARGNRLMVWSFGLLAVVAAAGLLMWWFPQDPIGAPFTAVGAIHIALAAVQSLGSLGAIGLAALAWRNVGNRSMALFSFTCLAVVLLTGPVAAFGAAFQWPVMGLFERITIGGFEIWMMVSGTVLLLGSSSSRFS